MRLHHFWRFDGLTRHSDKIAGGDDVLCRGARGLDAEIATLAVAACGLRPPGRSLNDKVLPLFEAEGMGVLRILTDRGSEFCGRADAHDYQLYLATANIDHTTTKARSPQTNGICERFHKTILQEFYQVVFRKKIYRELPELQRDLDEWIERYNRERTHQGKMCCGRTPYQTLIDGKQAWTEKVEHAYSVPQTTPINAI